MSEYFVLRVQEDGSPGKLTGPVDWDRATAILTSYVEKALKDEGKELSQDDRDAIELDGTYSFERDHGGVYILSAEEDEGEEEKTVVIVVADRDSSKSVQDTAHFSNWKQLKDDVELLVKESGFRKSNVELTASWDTSEEDDDMIHEIELG